MHRPVHAEAASQWHFIYEDAMRAMGATQDQILVEALAAQVLRLGRLVEEQDLQELQKNLSTIRVAVDGLLGRVQGVS